MKVKLLYIRLVENAYDVIMTSHFVPFFEDVNLSSSYDKLSPHQIWFNFDQGRQSYRGGRGTDSNPPQVDNVLDRPAKIGLSSSSRSMQNSFKEDSKTFVKFLLEFGSFCSSFLCHP